MKDGNDEDLTREPEMVKAFRDTWELGIHSYLTYLRDRLLLAQELLHESGSCFVQISDENLHHVRELMDEVFGAKNFCCHSRVCKNDWQVRVSRSLPIICDYLALVREGLESDVKYRQLYVAKQLGEEVPTAHTTASNYQMASRRRA